MTYNKIAKRLIKINAHRFLSYREVAFFVGVIFILMKICGKCGNKLPHNDRCHCQNERHKLYNAERRDKEKNTFYHSRQWKSTVEKVKARANGLDEYALSKGYLEKGNTVHHIYTIDERPDLKLSTDNLIYVSAKTHNQIHAVYSENQEKKTALQSDLKRIAETKT